MAELILHHFDASPFAEKIRLVLGLKALRWRSVRIPMVMPKPDLTALTGGYRKTPVLQIGADVFCDTRLIALELERRFPSPTLFPGASLGISLAAASWSDRTFFEPGAALSMGTNPDLPADVVADRKAFFNFMDFDELPAELPHLSGQLRAQAALVEAQLGDGRPFLLGAEPGWLDILAYFPLWMVRANVAGAEALLGRFPRVAAWKRRIAAWGHGTREELDPGEALAIARGSHADAREDIDADDPLGLAAGDEVTVAPVDYGIVPVRGRLQVLTPERIAVRREDLRAGRVVVHFPRSGYRVEKCCA
jgi:glutathione S-transferase